MIGLETKDLIRKKPESVGSPPVVPATAQIIGDIEQIAVVDGHELPISVQKNNKVSDLNTAINATRVRSDSLAPRQKKP